MNGQTELRKMKFACINAIRDLDERAPHRDPPSAMDKRVIAVYEKHIGPPNEDTCMEDRLMEMSLVQLNALIGALEDAVK